VFLTRGPRERGGEAVDVIEIEAPLERKTIDDI